MMKYLLDTGIIAELIKTEPSESVLKRIESHQQEVGTASPVWHELQYGCRCLPFSRKREIIESFLNDVIRPNLDILPYDERAAGWHSLERSRLAAKWQMPSFVDGQIAAIAKVNGLILVTPNIEGFELFLGLTLENWYD